MEPALRGEAAEPLGLFPQLLPEQLRDQRARHRQAGVRPRFELRRHLAGVREPLVDLNRRGALEDRGERRRELPDGGAFVEARPRAGFQRETDPGPTP